MNVRCAHERGGLADASESSIARVAEMLNAQHRQCSARPNGQGDATRRMNHAAYASSAVLFVLLERVADLLERRPAETERQQNPQKIAKHEGKPVEEATVLASGLTPWLPHQK